MLIRVIATLIGRLAGGYRYVAAGLTIVLAVSASAWAATETFGPTSPGRPENVNPSTRQIDVLFDAIAWMTGVVFVGVFGLLIVFLVKYRHRPNRRPVYSHGNPKLEAVWTLVPTLLMALTAGLSVSSWKQQKYVDQMPSGPDVLEVRVLARQFSWFFHYPGADGKFGRTSVLWRQNTGDPAQEFGLMRGDLEEIYDSEVIEALADDEHYQDKLEADPAAEDDVVTAQMYVPVDTKVHLIITSVDVLHSFFVPHLRVKQDAVPGLNGHIWLESSKLSSEAIGQTADGEPKPFEIVCAELCGAQHYTMRGDLFVVTRERFEQWLEQQAPEIEEEEYEDEEEYEEEEA